MISKTEFTRLYSKYLAGECTPHELELLDEYQDELDLMDFDWHGEPIDQQEIHDRIWLRVSESRKASVKSKLKKFRQLQVAAAILLIAAPFALWIIKSQHKKDENKALSKNNHSKVTPGGNKAFLTMANGSIITLTDARNGQLATQAGIQISKSKNGMLVYHFGKADEKQTNSSADVINTITTPRGGQYQVILSDGTKVWLNSATSLRFPVAFTGNSRNVELNGEAYFEVTKNAEKPFTVQANGTTTQVLGTHFNVNAYNDNAEVTTTLLEGSVRLQKGRTNAMLVPGEQGTILNNGISIAIKTADIEEVMAWKKGYFIFHDENIINIMKQVSRWYDVDVEYENGVKDKEFGGTVSRYKDITELLNNMELTQAIHYKLEGRRLYIMK
ncbi:MAG: FecR family protein [Mucilaginibacter sp.]|nr:FecR family protein [Mucilaginibacter sp.]